MIPAFLLTFAIFGPPIRTGTSAPGPQSRPALSGTPAHRVGLRVQRVRDRERVRRPGALVPDPIRRADPQRRKRTGPQSRPALSGAPAHQLG